MCILECELRLHVAFLVLNRGLGFVPLQHYLLAKLDHFLKDYIYIYIYYLLPSFINDLIKESRLEYYPIHLK
jgi:hypothetical protein